MWVNHKKLAQVLAILLPVQWVFYWSIGRFPEVVERYYSQGIYPFIAKVLNNLFGNVSIPYAQIFLLILVVVLAILLARAFQRKKRLKRSGWKWLKLVMLYGIAMLSVIYFFFMWIWGLNNYRIPVEEKFNLELKEEYTLPELEEYCKWAIERANDVRQYLNPEENTVTEVLINDDDGFNLPEYGHQDVAKAPVCPKLMAYIGISGIFSPFTGEAFVNTDRPLITIPFTAKHEIAHQLGYASEHDASYLGYLACTENNADSLTQYSGRLMAMRYGMAALHEQDSLLFNKLELNIFPEVRADLEDIKAYNEAHKTFLNSISNFSNDIFLKLNGQKGTESYSQVVLLLMADYEKRKNTTMAIRNPREGKG